MGVAQAIQYLIALASAAADLSSHAAAVSSIIKDVQASGRTTLTAAEWDSVVALDDKARARLQTAIDEAANLTSPPG